MKIRIIGFTLCTAFLFAGCKKTFLEVSPADAVNESLAVSTTANAYASLNGTYRALSLQYNTSQGSGGQGAMMIVNDMLGEDVLNSSLGNGWYIDLARWVDHRNANATLVSTPYRMYYRVINNANILIEKIDQATGSATDKRIIKGEAYALRAWAYFNLVQYFGKRYDASAKPNTALGVPLVLTSTLEPQPRATVEEVYTQIHKDIDAAAALLTASRVNKTHFNLNVVLGLRARVALTQQDWALAATSALAARTGFNLMSNAQYLEGFNSLANPEWMWATDQTDDQSLSFTSFFAYMSCNFNSTNIRTNPKQINNLLFNQIPDTDIRKRCWSRTGAGAITPPNGSTVTFMNQKFRATDFANSVGDVPYMRVAELFLIEAEARAMLGQNTQAQDILFTLVSNRDPAYVKSTRTGLALAEEIYIQRRIELWGEGFRFFDLKRINRFMDRNGTNHQPSVSLTLFVPSGDKMWEFLLPQEEINANPKVVQNPL